MNLCINVERNHIAGESKLLAIKEIISQFWNKFHEIKLDVLTDYQNIIHIALD